MVKNVYRSSREVHVILVRFWLNLNVLKRFSKCTTYIKFYKNPFSGSRNVPGEQMDRLTDMEMLIVACRDFVKTLKMM